MNESKSKSYLAYRIKFESGIKKVCVLAPGDDKSIVGSPHYMDVKSAKPGELGPVMDIATKDIAKTRLEALELLCKRHQNSVLKIKEEIRRLEKLEI